MIVPSGPADSITVANRFSRPHHLQGDHDLLMVRSREDVAVARAIPEIVASLWLNIPVPGKPQGDDPLYLFEQIEV
jgi:hypothetical protein